MLATLVAEALVLACLEDMPPETFGEAEVFRLRMRQQWVAIGPAGLSRAASDAWRLALVAIASAVDREGRLWPSMNDRQPVVEGLIRDFDSVYLIPYADENGLTPQQRVELSQVLTHACGQLLSPPTSLDNQVASCWMPDELDNLWPAGTDLDNLRFPLLAGEASAELSIQLGFREQAAAVICDLLAHKDLLASTLRYSLYCQFVERSEPRLLCQTWPPRGSSGWLQWLTERVAPLCHEISQAQQLFAGIFPALKISLERLVGGLQKIFAAAFAAQWLVMSPCVQRLNASSGQYDDSQACDAQMLLSTNQFDALVQQISHRIANDLVHRYTDQVVGSHQPSYDASLDIPAVAIIIDVKYMMVAYPKNIEQDYDIGAICDLVREAFTAKDLMRFCRDRPLFRPVLSRFSYPLNLEDMIDALIEYCEKQCHLDDLILVIRDCNPGQYARWLLRYPAAGILA